MKHKKICLMILTGVYIFFISIFSVKANGIGTISSSLTISANGGNVDTNSSITINEQSIIYGSALIYSLSQYPDMVNGIGIMDSNNNNLYMCTIGSTTLYNDTNRQIELVSFECNVPKTSGPYSNRLVYFKGTNGVNTGITTSGYVNIVPISNTSGSGGNSIDYTNNFSDLYWKLVEIKNQDSTFYNDIYVLIETKLNAILTALQNNRTSIQDIQNAVNEDVSNDYKQTPNQTDYNNYHNQEESIIGQISNTDTNAINIQNNNNANLFIWDTITRSLQSHAKVMALMISILSIGIIKLILNR